MVEKTLPYLDMNIFKRSFDNQSFPRIRLETAQIDTIFANVSAGKSEFCWSFILECENGLNPNLNRCASTILLSQNASRNISEDQKIREQAKQFE